MRNLLSDSEIKQMRNEITAENFLPKIMPPEDREYWDVERIVETLEYFQQIEEKYNKAIQPDRR